MKCALAVAMLVLSALSPGCSQLPPPKEGRSVPPTPTCMPATSQEAIEARLARQTAAVYRRATQLSYRADITSGDPPEHIWCTTRHGSRHELDLRVYDDTGLIYELHKRPDGAIVKIRERNYRGGQAEEYELPYEACDARRWNPRCVRGLNACMFGSSALSWLGPDAHRSAFLEEMIAASEYVGIRDVEGFPCDVVQNHRGQDFKETFYLDRESHVLRRWTQVWKGVSRDRVFSQIEIVSPQDKTGE